MNKKTLAALKASIQHWKENEAAEAVDLVSVFGEDCALCRMFAWEKECKGCPVAKKTGQSGCWGSPWRDAKSARDEWCRHPGSAHARDAFRAAARAEREFLESLLPESER